MHFYPEAGILISVRYVVAHDKVPSDQLECWNR